ncbi:hypothetical protein ABIC63_005588 [Pseudacidovorax sp. 1753]|uniref:hypothetical protein n=1 Tax=Pseudacidovorax sp. 1753 TaxID=3156419 RepID=UPI0033944042
MRIELDVFYPVATPAQSDAARAAALAVYGAAGVDPYDAWLAWAEEVRWMECGCDDAFRPSEGARRLMDVHSLAQVAANQVLGVRPGEVVSLDFVER